MKGTLYLIPTVLAEETEKAVLPAEVSETLGRLRHFLCENVRTTRRFLSTLNVHDSIESLHFEVLDKDTPEADLPRFSFL